MKKKKCRNRPRCVRDSKRPFVKILAEADNLNKQVIEKRVRRANLSSKPPKTYLDPERERWLYKEPTISSECADTIIRSLQPRIKLSEDNEFY